MDSVLFPGDHREAVVALLQGGKTGEQLMRASRRTYSSETIGRLAREYDLGVSTITRIVHARDGYAWLRTETIGGIH